MQSHAAASPLVSQFSNPLASHLPSQLPAGLQRGLQPSPRRAVWQLASFSGRLCEISGSAASAVLTLAAGLVAEAQQLAEPVVWIGRRERSVYPPDLAARGIDLHALAMVWVDGPLGAARAADLLLRSGAFGLVVLDLGSDDRLPLAAQNRLAALAKAHDTALVCLTQKVSHQPSIGSLVSLRAEATRGARLDAGFRCEARVIKDKRLGPGWTHLEVCRGPDGLD